MWRCISFEDVFLHRGGWGFEFMIVQDAGQAEVLGMCFDGVKPWHTCKSVLPGC